MFFFHISVFLWDVLFLHAQYLLSGRLTSNYVLYVKLYVLYALRRKAKSHVKASKISSGIKNHLNRWQGSAKLSEKYWKCITLSCSNIWDALGPLLRFSFPPQYASRMTPTFVLRTIEMSPWFEGAGVSIPIFTMVSEPQMQLPYHLGALTLICALRVKGRNFT